MTRHHQDADEDQLTEANNAAGAAASGGASIRGTRQVTQPSMLLTLAQQLLPYPPHSAPSCVKSHR